MEWIWSVTLYALLLTAGLIGICIAKGGRYL